jgi:hypothetical protein
MDSINRLNRVMEILRRQVADGSAQVGSTARTRDSSPPDRSRRSERPTVEQLRRRIADRVQTIDPDDPRRPQKARRAFLESVLAWEFGDAVLQDRQLEDLIAHIERTFDAAPDIAGQLDELLAQLQA